jgi:nitrogen regulatory protein P-II 1
VPLLIVIIDNEDILEELLTGWLDIGITGATLLDSTDSLERLSHHVPLFAGFRSLSGGRQRHSKTLMAAIEAPAALEQAVAFLESLCRRDGIGSGGVYMVLPLAAFGRLGRSCQPDERQRRLDRKVGRKTPAAD